MRRCSERLELLENGQDFKRGQCQKGQNQIEREGLDPSSYYVSVLYSTYIFK